MVQIKIYRKPAHSIWEDFKTSSNVPLEIGFLMLWLQTVIPVALFILSKIHSPNNVPSGWGIPGIYSVTFVLVRSVLLGFLRLKPLFFKSFSPQSVKAFLSSFALWLFAHCFLRSGGTVSPILVLPLIRLYSAEEQAPCYIHTWLVILLSSSLHPFVYLRRQEDCVKAA